MKILLCTVPDGSLERTLKPLLPRDYDDWQFPYFLKVFYGFMPG